MAKSRKMSNVLSFLFALINCLILLTLVVFCVIFFRGNLNLCSVNSDMSAPALKEGDIFCYANPEKTLKVGDVAIYDFEGTTIIQKVEDINNNGDEIVYSGYADGLRIYFRHSQVIGIYKSKLLFLSNILAIYTTIQGKIIVGMISTTILLSGIVLAKYSIRYDYLNEKTNTNLKK